MNAGASSRASGLFSVSFWTAATPGSEQELARLVGREPDRDAAVDGRHALAGLCLGELGLEGGAEGLVHRGDVTLIGLLGSRATGQPLPGHARAGRRQTLDSPLVCGHRVVVQLDDDIDHLRVGSLQQGLVRLGKASAGGFRSVHRRDRAQRGGGETVGTTRGCSGLRWCSEQCCRQRRRTQACPRASRCNVHQDAPIKGFDTGPVRPDEGTVVRFAALRLPSHRLLLPGEAGWPRSS